jgi:hypothetical protein
LSYWYFHPLSATAYVERVTDSDHDTIADASEPGLLTTFALSGEIHATTSLLVSKTSEIILFTTVAFD